MIVISDKWFWVLASLAVADNLSDIYERRRLTEQLSELRQAIEVQQPYDYGDQSGACNRVTITKEQ